MPINLKGRSILTLDELSAAEIRFLLRLASDLKAAKSAGIEQQRLKGKNIALIFEKDSASANSPPRTLPSILVFPSTTASPMRRIRRRCSPTS